MIIDVVIALINVRNNDYFAMNLGLILRGLSFLL
jgi:hypothetical protein